MARIGQLFGGRSATDHDGDGVDDGAERPHGFRVEQPAVDRDGDGVDNRTERRGVDPDRNVVAERAERRGVDRDRDGVADRTEAAGETRTWRLGRHRNGNSVDDRAEAGATGTIPAVGVVDRDRDTASLKRTIDREPDTVAEPVPARQAPARVSLLATLGLILGIVGVAAALTGLLAPWAIAVGALGLVFSFGGIIAGVRPNVAGRGLGTLGVLVSGTAVVFGILALTGQVGWLDSHTDQVARLKDWLDTQLPWMKDW
ncbi:DUF308 domain-containing protein [Dactylosporangium sp. CA-092794]|uniref:DUF308 domain-containing protein n=1 Tax=Dactylosporangium sp. CA-092794 TaxID=3239929 RepID=UPI003D9305FB